MALIKCKECGEEVSTQAKTCPKCGAKAPKKTSAFTWLVMIFIIFIVYAVGHSNSSQKSLATQKTTPSKLVWTTSTSKDKMTGKLSAYATSPISIPTPKMEVPYEDVHAWLGVGCNKNDEWAYVGFNRAPNLANTEIKDGHNLIKTRIKWGSEAVMDATFTQDGGASFIHFSDDFTAIWMIKRSESALLELQWYGQQSTYFKFSFNGASAAVEKIQAKCSQYMESQPQSVMKTLEIETSPPQSSPLKIQEEPTVESEATSPAFGEHTYTFIAISDDVFLQIFQEIEDAEPKMHREVLLRVGQSFSLKSNSRLLITSGNPTALEILIDDEVLFAQGKLGQDGTVLKMFPLQ